MLKSMYEGPKEKYLVKPGTQSCYEYLKECHAKISAEHGDYGAFVNLDSETKMSQFFADVEKLAAYLASQGFKKGDVFSIFLPTSAHAFVAFYALNKLGIITSFIHPLTPPDALAKILAHTKSKGMFILDRSSAYFGPVMNSTHTIVCSTSDYVYGPMKPYVVADDAQNSNVPEGETIFRYSEIMAGEYEPVETVRNLGKETMLYMHGGGTTGKSKTIQLSSFALNSLAYSLYLVDRDHAYGNSYNLCVLPCFHAFGLGGAMHYAICNAYTAIVIPKFDPEKANDYIKRYNVQEILGAPLMFRKMYDAPNFDNEGLKNLNLLFSGGDIVSEDFINAFNSRIAKNGGHAILNRGWGLTEMSAICSTNTPEYYRAESIGMTLPFIEAAIRDRDGKIVPYGTLGEISLRGDTMMNGYLHDDVIHEDGIWYDENGVAWIRTGDLGSMDEDGYLYFTSRQKRIIVIAGYNVYPYNMEQELNNIDYIRECCAVQAFDENAKPCVKLCVALNPTEKSEEEIKAELIQFCADKFDRFSIPRKVEILETLPRTKMEKIDFMAMTETEPAMA